MVIYDIKAKDIQPGQEFMVTNLDYNDRDYPYCGPMLLEAYLLDPQPEDAEGKITIVCKGKIRKLDPEDDVMMSYGGSRWR